MELKNLLKRKLCHKILKFFHENPTSIDTPRGVATWTNEDIIKVRGALKKLARAGLLVSHKVSSTIGYSYVRDKKKIAKINKLLKNKALL